MMSMIMATISPRPRPLVARTTFQSEKTINPVTRKSRSRTILREQKEKHGKATLQVSNAAQMSRDWGKHDKLHAREGYHYFQGQ
jgi:hypothetical protein